MDLPQGNPIGGLYPQPQAPTSGGGGTNSLLGMVQGLAQTQNTLNQNAQFQQQFRARQAMGPILQNSIGQDGQVDWNKAAVGVATNPDTAWTAGDFINQMTQRGLTQADTLLKQFDLQSKKYGQYNDALSSLLPKGTAVTSQDVIGKLADLRAAGIVTPQEALAYYQRLPPDGAPLAQYIQQHQLQTMAAKDRLDQLSGTFAERNALNPIEGPSGVQTPVPRAQVAPMVGPFGGQVPGSGAPVRGAANGAPVAQGGAIPLNPPAAIQAYNKGTGPLADFEKELNGSALTAVGNNAALKQQLDAVAALGPGGMGGGADTRTAIANYARNLGVSQGFINTLQGGHGPDAVAAAQEVQKYAARNAANVAVQALGSRHVTGGEFDTFKGEGNPNLNTNPEAFKKLTAFIQAANQISIDEQKAWNTFKGQGNTNPKFLQDPLSFQNKWTQLLQRTGRIGELTKLYTAAQGAWQNGK